MADSAAVDASVDASIASPEKKSATSDLPASSGDLVGDKASKNMDSEVRDRGNDCPATSAEANPFKMPMIGTKPVQKKTTLGVLAKAFTDKTEHIKTTKTEDKLKSRDQPQANDNGKSGKQKSDSNSEVKSATEESAQPTDGQSVTDIPSDTQKDDDSEKPPALTTSIHNKMKYLSPAERLKHSQIPINYKEPAWGSTPDKKYSFEVLKCGSIVSTIDLQTKSFHVFGRLPTCDVTLEHPSLSRYHAIMQFCGTPSEAFEVGWYLYDLDSTHGTWVNKLKVKPRIYQRIRVGHVVKFGGSRRLFILQGPDTDMEQESELTVTEMREQRELQKREAELMRRSQQLEREDKRKQAEEAATGSQCSWGIGQDDAEIYAGDNPFALAEAQNEDLYIADPKKTLKGFFEREGLELPEYNITDMGRGTYKCTVELPLDSPTGEPVNAEVELSGKKKEVVIACALEACRVLDRHGELRKATHESRKKKRKNWEDEDFYDSDEDTFLDRTGDIEKKRSQRKKRLGLEVEKAQSYDTLLEKLQSVDAEVGAIEERLRQAKAESDAIEAEEMDALDAFMCMIKSGSMDTKTKMTLKRTLVELRREQMRLQKLVNIAKPVMPALKKLPGKAVEKHQELAKTLPMTGKMRGLSKGSHTGRVIGPVGRTPTRQTTLGEEEEEEETEEELKEENKKKTTEDILAKMEESSASSTIEPSRVQEILKEEIEVVKVKGDGSSPTQPVKAEVKVNSERTTESKTKVDCESNEKATIDSTTEVTDGSKKPMTQEIVKEPTHPKLKRKSSETQKYGNLKKGKQRVVPKVYSSTDPDYVTWVPPDDQKGDGRTKLNEKYGY